MGKIGDLLRLTALLGRISRYAPERPPDPLVVEERDLALDDVRFDLYRPRAGRPLRTAVVAVHGVTSLMGRDPRMIHFARSLVRSGVACAVPHLEDLARARWTTRDLDRLEAVTREAGRRVDLPRVGLVGFSYGGSYSLVTAARPAIAGLIGFVIAIGGYHDLRQVFEWYVRTRHEEPTTEGQWDDRIYLHLILAQENRELLPDPERLYPAVVDLLERSCTASSPEEKRAFFEQHLRRLDLVGTAMERQDLEAAAAVSPAGKLQGIRCPVSVIHDTRDSIVPAEQAELLHAELSRLPRGERHRLLVTTLLSHVDLGNVLRLGELRRLYAAMAPIIGAA